MYKNIRYLKIKLSSLVLYLFCVSLVSWTSWWHRSVSCSSLSRVQLCDPMDCSPPGSSVHGILQIRNPEWVAIPFSRGYSQSRDRTWVSWMAGRFFTFWAIGKSLKNTKIQKCKVFKNKVIFFGSLSVLSESCFLNSWWHRSVSCSSWRLPVYLAQWYPIEGIQWATCCKLSWL